MTEFVADAVIAGTGAAVTAEEMAGEAAPEAAPAAPEAIDLADLLKKDAPAEETAE
jgi:small subunit ribosomal protein S2